MVNSKSLSLPLGLLIILLSFSLSAAHNKTCPPCPSCSSCCPPTTTSPPNHNSHSPPPDKTSPYPPPDHNSPSPPPHKTSPYPPPTQNSPSPPSTTPSPPNQNSPSPPPSKTSPPPNTPSPSPPTDKNTPSPSPPPNKNSPSPPPNQNSPPNHNYPSPPSDKTTPPSPPNTPSPSPPSDKTTPSPPPNTPSPSPPSDKTTPSPPPNTPSPSPPSDKTPSSPPNTPSPSPPSDKTTPSSPPNTPSPSPPSDKTSPSPPPNQGTTPSSPPSKTYKGCFKKIYAFGDSYTDTGNAHFLGGSLGSFAGAFLSHTFYGSTTFKKPMNRLCDGRLVLDFLSESLALPYVPPYHDSSANFSCGANFAVAGSTSLTSDFFLRNKIGHLLTWNPVPHSFLSQIDWFHKFVQEVDCKGKDESACKAEMGNALFWIGEMGVNDYSRTFGSSFSSRMLMEMSVNNVCRLLKEMLIKGAKYVVVQGLPPTGCLPLDLSMCEASDRDDVGCSASANAIIKAHNDLLQSKLAKLQEQFSGCSIIYADYWSAYRTILKKSKEFQFEEPYKACCGAGDGKLNFDPKSICGSPSTSKCAEPSKYINWDGVHLTEAMHEKLADLFFNQGFCRPSFDQMISAKLNA